MSSRNFLIAIVVVCCLVLAADAWPKARVIKPPSDGPNGDLRYIHQKLHRKMPERFDNIDGMKDYDVKHKCKSRSYHFKWGPRFPEHHTHLKDQWFTPKDHQLLYP